MSDVHVTCESEKRILGWRVNQEEAFLGRAWEGPLFKEVIWGSAKRSTRALMLPPLWVPHYCCRWLKLPKERLTYINLSSGGCELACAWKNRTCCAKHDSCLCKLSPDFVIERNVVIYYILIVRYIISEVVRAFKGNAIVQITEGHNN